MSRVGSWGQYCFLRLTCMHYVVVYADFSIILNHRYFGKVTKISKLIRKWYYTFKLHIWNIWHTYFTTTTNEASRYLARGACFNEKFNICTKVWFVRHDPSGVIYHWLCVCTSVLNFEEKGCFSSIVRGHLMSVKVKNIVVFWGQRPWNEQK